MPSEKNVVISKLTILVERSSALLVAQHFKRQRQAFSDFKASLVYKVSSRTAKATQRNPVATPPQIYVIFKFYMCECFAHMCFCAPQVCLVPVEVKRVLDPSRYSSV